MKKVIIFRTDLLPSSETFIKEQTLALTEWSPILVGYRKVANGLDLNGLDVRILPGMTSGRLQRCWLRLLQWLGKPHKPTVKALRAMRANLVHAHFGTDATDIWPSVKAAGLPMVVTLHGYDINVYREWWEAGHGGLRRRVYPSRLLEMSRNPQVSFIAVSKAVKARAVEYGIVENKVSVGYIGINTDRFKPGDLPIEDRPKRVLFVGRMVEKKAPLMLVRAFSEVRKPINDAELVIIGDGPCLRSAKQLAKALSVPVTFLGVRSSTEVIKQMQTTKLFCLPSLTAINGDAEGLPTVLLEALACGVPVITSARGAVHEVIQTGYNGICTPEKDTVKLADAIISLLRSRDIHRYSINARTSVSDDMSLRSCADKLQQYYDLCASSQ